MAIRDVGRVMGRSYGEADRLAGMIPFDPNMTLQKALEDSPVFKRAYDEEEASKRVIDLAITLEHISRHAGVHAAGIVISDHDLTDNVPLTLDGHGGLVTQYSMDSLGDLGLMKMDFFGLKTLTVIHDALRRIEEKTGRKMTSQEIPLDDQATFDLLSRAQNVGVFQLESPDMCDACRSVRPRAVKDIIALVALNLPWLMKFIRRYADRKAGRMPVEYHHPLLEPILKETYGIMVYQEQVMQAAQMLAGFTPGDADLLRRAMGRKRPKEMAMQRAMFFAGAKEKNNIAKGEAHKLFELLDKTAGHGWNKAHAACYGVLAYQTAWLKAQHPVAFMAALLSNELNNSERTALFVSESKAMGISIMQTTRKKGSGCVTVKDNSILLGNRGVFCAQIYRFDGDWYMDDPEKEIILEELILGMPEIIEHLVGPRNDRFICTFSAQPLECKGAVLKKDGESDGGCWYLLRGTSLRGWLCPTIFRYFDPPPETIYLRWK